MLRPRPLATVIAALTLLACVLYFAPIGSTRSAQQTLSPTPPVTLAPPPTTTTTPVSTTPTAPPPLLPKTGLEVWLIALVGIGLLTTGVAVRRAGARPAIRRSR